MIISDGPYGVGGFDGDLRTVEGLAAWYKPHLASWTAAATPVTTLWFWNTEEGWAAVHPLILREWEFRGLILWNKGKAHIAGNINTATLRRVPPVTEAVGHYVRRSRFHVAGMEINAQQWLLAEWRRARLTLRQADNACGVKNAASRKYLASDHQWYFPPPSAFDKLSRVANRDGDPAGRPYFSLDGKEPLTGAQWEHMRAKFTLEFGLTNVWDHPPLKPPERVMQGTRAVHPNQKPLVLIERIIRMTSDPLDVVWEPFGGLATATLAAARLERLGFGAEICHQMYQHGRNRLLQERAIGPQR